ncbi:MAG: hypothetical protein ACMXYC_02400 [Candidatus Woesearchaeota archaeon]
MNTLRFVGLVFVYLLISLVPIHALTITQWEAQGVDRQEGFMRSNDTLDVTVHFEPGSGQNYNATQWRERLRVRYGTNEQSPMFALDGCERSGLVFICRTTFDVLARSGFAFGQIHLVDTGNRPASLRYKEMVIDTHPPQINAVQFRQDKSQLHVSVDVEDLATLGFTDQGLGLHTLLVREGENELLEYRISGKTFKGTVNVSLDTYASGTYNFCVIAVDVVGHRSTPSCQNVVVDTQPPAISSVVLELPGNFSRDHIPQTISASFVARVQKDGRLASAIARIDGGQPRNAVCALSGRGIHECRVANIEVREGNYTVHFTVQDHAGYVDVYEQTFRFVQDKTAPVFVGFGSDLVIDDVAYASHSFLPYVEFEETGSGFYTRDVFVHNVRANRCVRDGNWKCYVNISLASGEQQLRVEAKDDAGNEVSARGELMFDVDAPRIRYVDVYSLTDTGSEVAGGIAGKPVYVEVGYSDALPVRGVANFSNWDAGIKQGECSAGVCSFRSDVILDGRKTDSISITLTDRANNTVVRNEFMEVAGLTDTRLFRLTSGVTPQRLSRGVARFTNHQGLVQVHARSSVGAELLDFYIDSCNAHPDAKHNDMSFVQEVRFDESGLNQHPSRTIRFLFKSADYSEVDVLRFRCQAGIVSRLGNEINPTELHDVDISFTFVGNYDAGLDASYQRALDKAIEEANAGLLPMISALETFVNFIRTICSVLQSVISVIYAIRFFAVPAPAVAATAVEASSGGLLSAFTQPKRAGANLACQLNEGKKALWGGSVYAVEWFCKLANCELSLTGEIIDATLMSEQRELAGSAAINFAETDPGLLMTQGNSHDSLFFSIINLCLPGIIKNIKEYREIKCFYAYCLQELVPQGTPKYACDEVHDYLQCKYVYGQIFRSIPFVSLFVSLLEQIIQSLYNPISAIFMIAQLNCIYLCYMYNAPAEPGFWDQVCNLTEMVLIIEKLMETVLRLVPYDFSESSGSYCDQLESSSSGGGGFLGMFG